MGETYAGAGVDIVAGEEAVRRIGPAVASTARAGVVGSLGGFGGLFDLGAAGRQGDLLVATTDGVGTKAEVAARAGRYDTIGIDLVAMCVDDLVCQGAEPLFLLDYLLVGRLDPELVEALVGGIAYGCRTAGCALIGGEMAEHPGALPPGHFDLAGFAVGAVSHDRLLTGDRIGPGDVVVGVPSPNLRSNGFSLARRVFFDVAGRALDDPAWSGADETVADVLLSPSVIYAPAVLAALDCGEVHGVAHITGGGLPGNLRRVLPPGTTAVVDRSTWTVPPVFEELARLGGIADDERYRAFNMGIGMSLVAAPGAADEVVATLLEHGHEARVIGEIRSGDRSVVLD